MSETTANAPLTVVLVHGAFADSSSWDGVIERLHAADVQVTAAPNPLRGISHDSAYVARLARSQERDLRSWLFEGESTTADTLASAMRAVAAEVEDAHGVSIDVVCVGDCAFSEQQRALVNATREALTNAAKHAGTGKVDLYAEVSPSAVEVFVRDRGIGFDPDAVPEGRMGVRGSIVDRMRRHGGTAEVRSTAGEGTEVRLRLPRTGGDEESNG